jgi:hypothetical protein
MSFSSQLGGPFDFCAFTRLSELLPGSLEIALKCTRPRQRFMFVIGRYFRTEKDLCQEGELFFCSQSLNLMDFQNRLFYLGI